MIEEILSNTFTMMHDFLKWKDENCILISDPQNNTRVCLVNDTRLWIMNGSLYSFHEIFFYWKENIYKKQLGNN